MGVIDEIIGNCEFCENKTEFKKLTNKDPKKTAEKLLKQITKSINIEKASGYYNANEYPKSEEVKFKHPGKCKTDVEKCNFSARKKKNGKFYPSPEDNMERMIKIVFNKNNSKCNIQNQIPIPDIDQASHIDLMIRKPDTIELIELKQWYNDKNPPTFAVAESTKNLYMFLHFNKNMNDESNKYLSNIDKDFQDMFSIEGINTFILTLLAPEEYYVDHFRNDSNLKEVFKEFCDELQGCIQEDLKKKLNNKNLKIKINIKSFNFSREEYDEIINNIIEKHLKENNQICKVGEKTENIDLSKYSEYLNDVCSNLINWKNALDENQKIY